MKKKYFDFDKLFQEYMLKKIQGDKDITPEFVQSQLGELYAQWSQSKLDVLGGFSPSDYFSDISDADLLVEFLINSCENDSSPNAFLLDRICELEKTAPLIRQLIFENRNACLTLTCIELLQNMNVPQPLEEYADLLKECDDIDLRETIISILTENADKVKESLYDLLPLANIELKTVIAEILINASKDERTRSLLTELFIESENVPLISSYIGKYGDEEMVSLLYKALGSCNYMEFIEIKNAIERMGGVVGDDYDFSEDAYYKIIKGN